jgi:excisionase family DNA binding protein
VGYSTTPQAGRYNRHGLPGRPIGSSNARGGVSDVALWSHEDSVCVETGEEEMQQPNEPDRSPLFTIQEAAQYLAVSPALIYRLVAKSEIEHVRIGIGRGLIRFGKSHLDDYKRHRRT